MLRPLLAILSVAILASLGILFALTPPRLTPPEQSALRFSGVIVINPGTARLEDQTLVVREGRIAGAHPSRSAAPAPICDGRSAIPGLIDAYVHTPPWIAVGNQRLFALLYLAHGVTTVRDVGQSDGSVAGLAAQLNAGQMVGPHMLRCGPILEGDPPTWPMAKIIRTAEEGTAIVAELAGEGVDCIKVYNEISPAAYDAIAAAARERGLPLVGHVPHAVGLAHVSDFEAQHMTGVPYVSRPRPPFGSDIRAEDIIARSEAEVAAAVFLPAFRSQARNFVAGHPEIEAATSRPARSASSPRARAPTSCSCQKIQRAIWVRCASGGCSLPTGGATSGGRWMRGWSSTGSTFVGGSTASHGLDHDAGGWAVQPWAPVGRGEAPRGARARATRTGTASSSRHPRASPTSGRLQHA